MMNLFGFEIKRNNNSKYVYRTEWQENLKTVNKRIDDLKDTIDNRFDDIKTIITKIEL